MSKASRILIKFWTKAVPGVAPCADRKIPSSPNPSMVNKCSSNQTETEALGSRMDPLRPRESPIIILLLRINDRKLCINKLRLMFIYSEKL